YKTIDVQEYVKIWRSSVESLEALTRFWGDWARRLVWRTPWRDVFDGRRWFPGGELNASVNVLDRHRGTYVWDKVGLIFETEEGNVRAYTYSQLHALVEAVAAKFRALGLGIGDYAVIYAPPLPETLASAWALARIGATFEWVFTGWGRWFLAMRLRALRPKLVVTADAFPRRGKPIRVKDNVDAALKSSGLEAKVVVVPRMGVDISTGPNDIYLADIPDSGERGPAYVESSYPLFALPATEAEGSEGTVLHETGGYLTQTYATTIWMGLRPRDTYFCTVLPGWITGITYVLFGPFMVGSTVVVYEGGPDYPSWDRWWEIVEKRAVTVFLTTVGALRLLSKFSSVERYNLDTLRLVLTTAEPMEEEVWWWAYRSITGRAAVYDYDPKGGGGRIPVIHYYITREVGTFFAGNLPNFAFAPIKPGTSGLPFPGFALDSIGPDGTSVRNSAGRLVLRMPWPAMPLESHRWRSGLFYLGDYGIIDSQMYVRVVGRDDGVLKVNGYRISPGDIKKALAEAGVEAEVKARFDPQKFQVPLVRTRAPPEEVIRTVRTLVGPIAEPEVEQLY
ncbi:MAG: AMP-binding protein, partial [Thermoproteus sp.]